MKQEIEYIDRQDSMVIILRGYWVVRDDDLFECVVDFPQGRCFLLPLFLIGN